ncbi:MAG TPA: 4-alpha-glucanotransferase [Vicinamibacterales bacterium]|nr:4-alpha-glucanotransferase [Vicinamibacterales bacterium]
MRRHAGLQLPLFSAASSTSWGIGELGDVVPLAAWLASAGFDRLMLLPIGAMAAQQSSPYSAMSAMAIDPTYIGLGRLEDFARLGGEDALGADARASLEAARARSSVSYDAVRRAKDDGLRRAFDRFVADEWSGLTPRAAALSAYIARERAWLDDYALYVTLSEKLNARSWRQWPEPLRDRDSRALDDARRQFARDVLRHQYLQWVAETEWQQARAAARDAGVAMVGDFTFAVEADSVDVWTRQEEFALDISAGAPPDAFSDTGQDWNLPMYRWDAIAATDYAWLRQRVHRMAALFDGLRIDHVVGFYRTYGKPAEGAPFFSPAHESDQLRQGEAILRLTLESGAMVIAEDLGTIPDFVRASLARLGIPGSKVLRWERAWYQHGQPLIEPGAYPVVSAAMTGTHDTEPLAIWWERAGRDERVETLRLLFTLEEFQRRGSSDPDQPWNEGLRDGLLECAYHTASTELFVPVQDAFGWRDRINTPASISEDNWTWRLPWPVDRLATAPEAVERAAFLRAMAERTGRALKK